VKQGFSGRWVWQLSTETAPEGDQSAEGYQSQKVRPFDGGDPLRGDYQYPDGLLEAAAKACQGLKVTAGQLIADLDPDDYPIIINHPETARSMAERMAFA
jgi:hypothetical protein